MFNIDKILELAKSYVDNRGEITASLSIVQEGNREIVKSLGLPTRDIADMDPLMEMMMKQDIEVAKLMDYNDLRTKILMDLGEETDYNNDMVDLAIKFEDSVRAEEYLESAKLHKELSEKCQEQNKD
jgi:hypothetical protein